MAPHILCFNPYPRWSLHSARQATVLHALNLRGATSIYVACDGVLGECDMHPAAKGPAYQRTAMSCFACQALSATRLAKFGLPFYWIGRWLMPEDIGLARSWARDLPREGLQSARFEALDIGQWVGSSVHTHFRANGLNMDDPEVERVYRAYLYGGLVTAIALARIIDQEQPDAQLLFNGRMAPTRIALEMARIKGVRTICEERGFTPGHMRLVENTHCLDPSPFYGLWDAWRGTPLLAAEIETLDKVLSAHRKGQDFEVALFAAPVAGTDITLESLGLDNEKPAVGLFSSATDEAVGQPEAIGIYSDQQNWIKRTVELIGQRDDVQLVVRAHPNTGGKRAVGTNSGEMEFFESLKTTAPSNVTVIMPEDEISSFDLLPLLKAGLIWHSSLGLEMAAMGTTVLRAGAYWMRHADFMFSFASAQQYEEALNGLTKARTADERLDQAITAWRFAYCWHFRQSVPFPLVRQPDWAKGEPAYSSEDDLAPGKDDGLDRVCRFIANGEALYQTVGALTDRSAEQERQMIAERITPLLDR